MRELELLLTRRNILHGISASALASIGGCAALENPAQSPPSATEVERIAYEAYIWGYPLVVMERTRLRGLYKPSDGVAGETNKLKHFRALLNWRNRTVVMPNADTLYSSAWLDLSQGPMVLSVPALSGAMDRYYSYQLMDWYTNTVGYVGTRTVGKGASRTLIAGPQWNGALPTGMRLQRCPTNKAWLLGRTLVDNPKDLSGPRALQEATLLESLDASRNVDWKETKPENVESPQSPKSRGIAFFDELAAQLVGNLPPSGDRKVLERFGLIGIAPGAVVSVWLKERKLDAAALAGIEAADRDINIWASTQASSANGWYTEVVGAYGADYPLRARTARSGLAALTGEEAKYFHLVKDLDGNTLMGTNAYTLTIDPTMLPPVGGFWSLSVYSNKDFFPAVNAAIDRFSISDRTPGIRRNPDNSITIVVSSRPPTDTANWIPAPEGELKLGFRAYGTSGTHDEFRKALPMPKRVVS